MASLTSSGVITLAIAGVTPAALVSGVGIEFSVEEQLPRRNVKRFRGELVPKAHRLVHHTYLDLTVMTKQD